jgi:DNA-binding transcriptional LysR family regulator
VRNKGGTTLTAAGRQFEKHAFTLVRTVERARHDVGVPRGFRDSLTVGGRFGLWEDFLLSWLPLMRKAAPDVSLRAEIGFEADLMLGLVEGRLDLAVMYTPQRRPGLEVEMLFEERLLLVSTDPAAAPEPGPDYVYVDWGPEFYTRHSASFPNFIGPALSANIGWLGQQHVLAHGGSGYFPARVVRPHLESGRLVHLAEAPAFSLPAYAVYPADLDPDLLATARSALHEAAAAMPAR